MLVKRETFSSVQIALIMLAMLIGAWLRLAGNNQPFPSSDHAELAALVTFFYPRDWSMLLPSSTSTWNLLTTAHGILPLTIGLISSTLTGLMGIKITEFWWNLPFVLTNLLAIPLAASLTKRLSQPKAGVFAAFLIALMPIHIGLSRASGLSHISLTFCCQLLSLLALLNYFEDQSPRQATKAGLALALNLCVEQLFPLLFILIFLYGILVIPSKPNTQPSLMQRVERTRHLLFTNRVMILPLLMICFHFVVMLGYIGGFWASGGPAARLRQGSSGEAGLHLFDAWNNASYCIGSLSLALLLGLGMLNLPALWRLEKRAFPLLWSLVYLLPFVLFTRKHVYELFILGLAPLTFNAAIMLATVWQRSAKSSRRWLTYGLFTMLSTFYLLRTFTMIFGFNPGPELATLVGIGEAPGAIMPKDQGLKAAAWWVRQNSQPADLIFGDSAYEQYQLWYYLHRPFLGVTDATSPEEAYLLLKKTKQPPKFYLVKAGNEGLLKKYVGEEPYLVGRVVERNEDRLLIYSGIKENRKAQVIDVLTANEKFDEAFGGKQMIFALKGFR
jgi:hypothetical protein